MLEKYSVLMPVYYRERPEHLRQSVQSMLDQTVPPDEFVIVCDGPLTEGLDGVIAEFEEKYPDLFRIIRLEKNCGIGTALNTGLAGCSHELVARMDSDDIAVPERMALQLAEMERCPDLSAVGGQIAEFYDDPERVIGYRCVPTGEAEIYAYAKLRNPMNHMTVLMKKSHVAQVGNYQMFPGPGFEDYYLWVSLLADGRKLRNLDAICCRVRAGDGLFERRGGWAYFRNCRKVEKLLLETGIISPVRYMTNNVMWFTGTMVLPPGCRKSVFVHFLRQRALKKAAGAKIEEKL